ncbi:MAG: hypothetical protein ACRD22_03270 [Terriglobia bacterium]
MSSARSKTIRVPPPQNPAESHPTRTEPIVFDSPPRTKVERARPGAVGKYGSIARIERFRRSLKIECPRVLQVPLVRKKMLAELRVYADWFNRSRPHQGLQGRTPDEKYRRIQPKATYPRLEPQPQWPPGSPCAAPKVAVRGECGARFTLDVGHFQGRKHLPIATLKRVA